MIGKSSICFIFDTMNYIMPLHDDLQEFNSVKEAFNFLVNEAWDDLDIDAHARLRDAKRAFNHHKSISHKRMVALLNEFGFFKNKVFFQIKK